MEHSVLNEMFPSNSFLQCLGTFVEKEMERVWEAEEMDDIKETVLLNKTGFTHTCPHRYYGRIHRTFMGLYQMRSWN